MVGHQKHRAAVDASRERDANRVGLRARVDPRQPLADLVGERADVAAADLVEILRERAPLRREETRVDRIGIGTPHEREVDDVVGRHHARVARVELRGQAVGLERGVQRVDAIGDVQGRAFVALGQEIPQRAIHRPRHADRDALGRDQREGSVDGANRRGVAAQHAAPRLVQIDVRERVQRGIEQIDDAADDHDARRARRLDGDRHALRFREDLPDAVQELTDDGGGLALAPRHADVHRRVRIADRHDRDAAQRPRARQRNAHAHVDALARRDQHQAGLVVRTRLGRGDRARRHARLRVQVEDFVVEVRRDVPVVEEQRLGREVADAQRLVRRERAVRAQHRQHALLIQRHRFGDLGIEVRPPEDDVERSVLELVVVLLGAHHVGRFDRQVAELRRRRHADAVDRVPEPPADAEADLVGIVPRRLVGALVEVRGRGRQRARFLEQVLSGFRQRDALTMTDEQRDAELILELLDVPAQRWLRDVEPLGGLGHAGFFRDGDERAQVAEIHGRGFYTSSVWVVVQRCIGQSFPARRRVMPLTALEWARFSRYWCQPP